MKNQAVWLTHQSYSQTAEWEEIMLLGIRAILQPHWQLRSVPVKVGDGVPWNPKVSWTELLAFMA